MAIASHDLPVTHSPLEGFVRDYVETIGGVWDEIEPQVYDVLIPPEDGRARLDADGQNVLRIAFDPEAIPEHPGAQLASFGTPLIDRLLADAVRRGRRAQFYFAGLNLAPHDLANRVRRTLAPAPGLDVRPEKVRALYFGQAVFWFQAAFVSDQKEQEILPVALDLHYGRRVRHLERLLDHSRLIEHPAEVLPETRRLSLAAAYPIARNEVVGTLAALANTRARELAQRLERQIARMARYYADLRHELEDQGGRSRDADEGRAKLAARRVAIDHEERLRVAELRQKNTLRVNLRLLNLLVVQHPKLLVQCSVVPSKGNAGHLELVWDPLLESLEAFPCPTCGRPTFAFSLDRQGAVVCPACADRAPRR